jgi:hypothetical protein
MPPMATVMKRAVNAMEKSVVGFSTPHAVIKNASLG